MSAPRQCTLAAPACLEGIALHAGQSVRLTLRPAPVNSGYVFIRADLPGAPEIKAAHETVNAAALARRTEIAAGGASVATIEHVLAALLGLGVDNARIELDGPEVPILDGSAQPFVQAIGSAGLASQDAPKKVWRLRQQVSLVTDRAEIIATPAESMQLAFFCELAQAGMPNQSAQFTLGADSFGKTVAPARTFVFYEDVEKLRAAGLIRGGSLDCALVLKDGAPFGAEYRLPDELAAHKLLDLVGDLATLGRPLAALVTARATGHALHYQFIDKLMKELVEDDE